MYKTLIFAFIMLATIACNNDNSTQNASINNTKNNTSTYNWPKHNNARIFFADFQKALKNRDQDAVYQMFDKDFFCITSFCLNKNNEAENISLQNDSKYKDIPHLGFQTKEEFYQKYDYIFTKEYLKLILSMNDIQTKEEILEEKIRQNAHESEIAEIKYGMQDYAFDIPLENGELFLVSLDEQGIYKIHQMGSYP